MIGNHFIDFCPLTDNNREREWNVKNEIDIHLLSKNKMSPKESAILQLNLFFLPELSSIIWGYLDFRPFVEYMTQKYLLPTLPTEIIECLNMEVVLSKAEVRFEEIISRVRANKTNLLTWAEADFPASMGDDCRFWETISDLMPNYADGSQRGPFFLYLYDFYGQIDKMIVQRSPKTAGSIWELDSDVDETNREAYHELFRFAYCFDRAGN